MAGTNVPSADREVAAFIEITAQAISAKRALEIGMAIGYTTTHLARAVGEEGLVVTIDPSDEMIKASEGYSPAPECANVFALNVGKRWTSYRS